MGARGVGVVEAGRLGWQRGGVGGGRLVGGVAEGVGWRMASLYYGALSAENRWWLRNGADAEVELLFKCVAVDVLVVCFVELDRLILLELACDRGSTCIC